MARKKMTDVERNLMKEIANNIKGLLKSKKWTQKDLADRVGLSTSVVSDYLNEKTLPTPGSIQQMADAFGVLKSTIDPTFNSSAQAPTEEEKLRFFEELERDLGVDLTDPAIQKMIKKAAKVLFSNED